MNIKVRVKSVYWKSSHTSKEMCKEYKRSFGHANEFPRLKNEPTCALVAANNTVAHKKSKQHSFNAKVSFSLVLPYYP